MFGSRERPCCQSEERCIRMIASCTRTLRNPAWGVPAKAGPDLP